MIKTVIDINKRVLGNVSYDNVFNNLVNDGLLKDDSYLKSHVVTDVFGVLLCALAIQELNDRCGDAGFVFVL